MEGFEGVDLLPHAHELDRLAGDVTYGQGRTATRITVGLGQHDTGQRQGFMEGLGGVGGILTGHRIDDEQRLVGIDAAVQGGDLVHHVGIDMQATGGIDQHHVVELDTRVLHRRFGDGHRLLGGVGGEEIDPDFLGQRFQLVDGGRTIDVGRDHQHLLLLALAQVACQLGDGGRLARTLQACHQNDGRTALERQTFIGFAHDRFQLLLDDLDELLARRQALGHFLTDGTFAHSLDEGLDHRQRDIGFKQRLAHFAQGVLDVVFRQLGLAGNRLQRMRQAITQTLKHGPLRLGTSGVRAAGTRA